jgi:hypothetical protein
MNTSNHYKKYLPSDADFEIRTDFQIAEPEPLPVVDNQCCKPSDVSSKDEDWGDSVIGMRTAHAKALLEFDGLYRAKVRRLEIEKAFLEAEYERKIEENGREFESRLQEAYEEVYQAVTMAKNIVANCCPSKLSEFDNVSEFLDLGTRVKATPNMILNFGPYAPDAEVAGDAA